MKSIEPYETERVAKIRERITDALEKTISVDYDKNRLEQELIYYIEKLDINEEKQRLANQTNHAEMQNIVVQMKDELEQIKEQVLNVM